MTIPLGLSADVGVRPAASLTLLDDSFNTAAGGVTDLAVTANDTIAGAGAFVVSVSGPSAKGGSLEVVGNRVRYTPPSTLAIGDTDTFSYTVTEENWLAASGGNLPVMSADTSGLSSSFVEPNGAIYVVTSAPGFAASTWDGVQYSSANVNGEIDTSSLYRHVIEPDLSADIQSCSDSAAAFDVSVAWNLTKTVGPASGYEASIARGANSPQAGDFVNGGNFFVREDNWPAAETRVLNLQLTGLTAAELTDLQIGLWAQDGQSEENGEQNDWLSNSVQMSYQIDSDACQLLSATATVSVTIGAPPDADGDSILDRDDIDDDNDGIPDSAEQRNGADLDTDGDGVVDRLDLDSDNDGLSDSRESGIAEPEALDTDANGRLDGVVGGNGLADVVETGADSGTTAYQLADTDQDGVADFQDLDSDNDGVVDLFEAGGPRSLDTDNNARLDGAVGADGIVDALQPVVDDSGYDLDRDGAPDALRDSDEDGTPDFRDLDSDDDTISDLIEAGGTDAAPATPDGMVDDFADSDGDGLDDGLTALPLAVPDTDQDGQPNFQDTDSDGDGLSDREEGLRDSDNNQVPDYLQANRAIETGLSGGGCSLGDARGTDPVLPLLLAVSLYFALRGRRKH
ncbi:MAG: hypothetical protein KDJ38_02515 [Gammaproteobacteria bacterium]|nr:hypothetical protein [Gammaproteobacteria bacterium]